VNSTPLLESPPTVTTIFPDVVPPGTVVTIVVEFHVVAVPPTPLNVTVLVPCVAPKLLPVIVTVVPTAPEPGVTAVITGVEAAPTTKFTLLLAMPPTVTTTGPLVAPVGTHVEILVALQPVTVATSPWKVTVLVPCAGPKFVPEIVTHAPTGPEAGDMLEIKGATALS